MTKQEFDSKFAGENTVVNCRTEELARKFLDKATEFGYKWVDGSEYKFTNWKRYEASTVYHLHIGKYGNKNWLIDDEVVVEFNGFKGE